MTEPIIVQLIAAQDGDVIEHKGKKLLVGKHYSQGKDLIGSTYIMFDAKGAFELSDIAGS